MRHNHSTRDIKPLGQCPACDEYHDRHIPKPAPPANEKIGVFVSETPAPQEPREWWIYRYEDGREELDNDEETRLENLNAHARGAYIHVIEMSAFDRVVKERDDSRNEFQHYIKKWAKKFDTLTKERDAALARIERLEKALHAMKVNMRYGLDAEAIIKEAERLERGE